MCADRDEDQPPHMWSYWRDKCGPVEAAKEYYPNAAKNNPQVVAAIAQVQNGELLLDSLLDGDYEEDDEQD